MNTNITSTRDTATTSPHPPTAGTPWTVERIHALGAATTLPTAAAILGISRSQAYRLAATDTFPAPLIRAGTRIIVPVAGLLRLLLLDNPAPATDDSQRLDSGPVTSVDATTPPPADYHRHRWRHHAEHPGDKP
ncbi:helix-turn-helix transcriptional regulator [Micromonospora sp. NPDC049900]|uniref:helix-turn-helix transcriptional regulator n=1 Tax=Micromonospora sp. NPDC049900 TaxID=3364275 RepID=UPI00378A2783